MSRDIQTNFVTDRAGMSTIIGCSINHVNKLCARGMPRKARGQYGIPECVQWLIADATSASGIDPDELPAVVEARTRLTIAQEEHKRLEIDKMRGALIDAEEVRLQLLEFAHLLVSTLEGLPVRAAQEAAAARTTAEAAAILQEHCVAARQELAEQILALAAPDAHGAPGDDAAAHPNGRRMGRRGTGRAPGKPEARALAN